MSYTTEDIARYQSILDQADPFLTEALYYKSDKELAQMLERLLKEREYIPKSNVAWMERQDAIIKTVSAAIDIRKAYKDDQGGVSII